MANVQSVLDSVCVFHGVVRFPSRYAACKVMEAMEDLFLYCRSDYRILTVKDTAWHVVYWTRYGTLFDADDLQRLAQKHVDCLLY